MLAQRKADAAAHSSQGAVVQALLAVKASGDIPGIHGRLGMCASFAGSCREMAADLHNAANLLCTCMTASRTGHLRITGT